MKRRYIMRILMAWIGLSAVSTMLPAQQCQIELDIDGINDTSLILAHRYGDKFYTDDTIRLDPAGKGEFIRDSLYPAGMYQLVFPDKSFTEFFLDDDQQFTLKTRYPDFLNNNQAIGHLDNQLFYNWYRASALYRNKPEMTLVWDTTLQAAGNSLTGQFLAALQPFQFPDSLRSDQEFMSDQLAQYHFYKAHYFDQVKMNNPDLLRTPIIHNKLNGFFEKIAPPQPDSITYYADQVLSLTEPSREVFRYVLQWLLNYYSEPKIMGTDAVYVYLADKYYLSGIADWISEDNLNLIKSRVEELRPLLLGREAPLLEGLQTPEGEPVDPFESNAQYKILYFWEPDCGHCKTATPELFALYPDLKKNGFEVFAINTRINKESWMTFIAEHELTWVNLWAPNLVRNVLQAYQAWSTPKLIILNNKNQIIAKDLAVSQVKDFITYMNKQ